MYVYAVQVNGSPDSLLDLTRLSQVLRMISMSHNNVQMIIIIMIIMIMMIMMIIVIRGVTAAHQVNPLMINYHCHLDQ